MKSSKNLVVVVLALLLLGAGVLAWSQYQELIRLRVEAGSASDRADLQRRLTDAERRLRALQSQLAAARGRGASGGADADDVAADNNAPRAGRRGGPGGRFAQMQALLNNPQVQKLQAIQMKAALDNRYAALFKTLNLPAAQLDQLKDLLVQKQQAQQDARQAAMQQGLNPRNDPQAFQDAITAAQGTVDDQIKTSLGDANYAQYQQYQQTLPERGTVTQVQQTLSYSSTPLTDDQSSQLMQILAQNAPASTAGTGGGYGGGGGGGGFGPTPTTPITNQVIAAAQTILSSSQLQGLQQIQQQQQAQQQMMQMMQAARQSAGAAGGGGGQRGGGG